jgi:putative transposase
MAHYARNAGAVFDLKLHLVWCPKYRRSVLAGKIVAHLRTLLLENAAELEVTIQALEIMPDHGHVFIEFDPCWAVAEIANRYKDYRSRMLRQEFAQLRSRLPTLWSRSYYAGTGGHVCETTVRRYSAAQATK